MLLIILLILVVGVKYISFKENFYCPWGPKIEQEINLREKRKREYYDEETKYKDGLVQVKEKQNDINVENDALEKLLIDTNDKYTKILEENKNLVQYFNKTKINNDNCNVLNKLKLIGIKKIYS